MAFLIGKQESKSGLIIFRRGDVAHRNFYCRTKLPQEDRYKTIALRSSDREVARDRAFDQDADIRFRIKHERTTSLPAPGSIRSPSQSRRDPKS